MGKVGTKILIWFDAGSTAPAIVWESQDIDSGLCSLNETESFIYIYIGGMWIKSIISLPLFAGRKQHCLEKLNKLKYVLVLLCEEFLSMERVLHSSHISSSFLCPWFFVSLDEQEHFQLQSNHKEKIK